VSPGYTIAETLWLLSVRGGLFYQIMNDEICRKRPIVTRGSVVRERDRRDKDAAATVHMHLNP
jgi:hypothetical protein